MKRIYLMAMVAMLAVCTSCGNAEKATPVTENDTIVNATDIVPAAATDVLPAAAPSVENGGKVATEVIPNE